MQVAESGRQARLEATQSVLPQLSHLRHCQITPNSHQTCWEVPPDFVDKAAGTASWSMAHSRTSNLQATLTGSWHSRCESVGADPKRPLPSTDTPSACLEQGFCTCGKAAGGRQLQQMRNSFMAKLKQQVKQRGPDQSQSLRTGDIVIELKWEKDRLARNSWAAAARQAAGLQLAPEHEATEGRRWLHIGCSITSLSGPRS